MKIILLLLLAFLSLTYSRAQEASPSITVENYFCFLIDHASMPEADQIYDLTMQDQIQRVEEGDQITYCIVDGQKDQPMSGLTDVEIERYTRWAETPDSTSNPLMMFLPDHNSDSDKSDNNSHDELDRKQLRADRGCNDPSSLQQRGKPNKIQENSNLVNGPRFYCDQDQLRNQEIQLSFTYKESFRKNNDPYTEITPLLSQGKGTLKYSEQIDRSSLQKPNEELVGKNIFGEAPASKEQACLQSSLELTCCAIMCIQPAAVGSLFITTHTGYTAATCAKAYLYGSLFDGSLIIPSIVVPIACFHFHDAIRPYICPSSSPCIDAPSSFYNNNKTHLAPSNITEAVAKRCIDIKNCLPCFPSSEAAPTNREDFDN